MYLLKPTIIIVVFFLVSSTLLVKNANAPARSHLLNPDNSDTTLFNKQFYLLKNSLKTYDSIAKQGGWDSIPTTKDSIKLGKTNSIISQLRRRLETEGYLLKEEGIKTDSFDIKIKDALENFQKNNGLKVTGELNSKTTSMLNISVEKRINQIKINMERWKKSQKRIEKEYIFINTANFTMEVIKNDSIVLKMKTVVGKPYRSTPVFNSKMTYIVFNPKWNIPVKIIKKDILPLAIEDSSYLQKKNIRIFKSDNGIRKEISSDSINWSEISIKKFSYQLVQDPGTDNSLGVIKFIFPNSYDVYMHDTPSKKLFEKTERTFSSGCIRLSNAFGLAEYLLKDKWDRNKIIKTIASGETVSINLSNPINVYIEYFTAWVDEKGKTQFRKDIYKRDVDLLKG